MDKRNWPTRLSVAGLVLLGVGLPLALAEIVWLQVPTVTPEEAKERLARSGSDAVLADVRPAERFAAGHLDVAMNWPLDDILAATDPVQPPPALRGKTLLLVCDQGIASAGAAWHLRRRGFDRAENVRGGVQEWMRSAPQREAGRWDRWRTPNGLENFPFRGSPPIEQALAVLGYFFIKPIYMTLSLALVALLWKSCTADLAALRWGLLAFFLGETACAVNYFGYKETSYLWEYLHMAGMFVSFGFLAYAVLEGVDRRILGLSDPRRRCAAVRLCGACIKKADVPCGLQRSFYLWIPALMIVAGMIPTADWQDTSYNTLIFGHAYNYGHLRVFQIVENWCCPAAAVVMFGVSLGILFVRGRPGLHAAKIALAAGLGPLGFGMLRMLTNAAYDQNRVWFLFWEEATEMLMVGGIACLLWIFRRRLLPGVGAWWQQVMRSL